VTRPAYAALRSGWHLRSHHRLAAPVRH